MNKVYLVTIDNYDGEGSAIIESKVFSTLEKAKAHLKMCVEDFKKDVSNWDDEDIYTVDQDEDTGFTWYESGYYDQNHYCVNVYEKEVE